MTMCYTRSRRFGKTLKGLGRFLLILLLGLQLSTANAELPSELNWLYEIEEGEQSRAILMMRNLFHTKSFNSSNEAKSDSQREELAFLSSVKIKVLSRVAIDKQLKELLAKESKLIGDVYVLGFENLEAQAAYAEFKKSVDSMFFGYSEDSYASVFKKYQPLMDKTIAAVNAYSEEMLKELSTNSSKRTNQTSISKALSDEINSLISQNKGVIRVGPATYLNSSLSSGDSLVLSFVISKAELAESYENSLGTLNSIEFKESFSKTQSETLNNYYCSLEASRQLLKLGGTVVVNYAFDDGAVPSGPIVIDSKSCESQGYLIN